MLGRVGTRPDGRRRRRMAPGAVLWRREPPGATPTCRRSGPATRPLASRCSAPPRSAPRRSSPTPSSRRNCSVTSGRARTPRTQWAPSATTTPGSRGRSARRRSSSIRPTAALRARSRGRERRTPQGTYGNGPFDSPQDFTLYDRCITLGVDRIDDAEIYGNGYRIVQAPGYAVIMAEMIHEARVIPLDGRRARRAPASARTMGDSRGALGRRHARHRDDQLQRQGDGARQPGAGEHRAEDHRAHHASRGGSPALRRHRHRSQDLHAGRTPSRSRSPRRPAIRCCRTSATRATWRFSRASAASAPKIGRSKRIASRASSARGGRYRAASPWEGSPFPKAARPHPNPKDHMKPATVCVATLVALGALGATAWAQAPDGAAVFEKACANCHQNPAADSRAPNRAVLAEIAPETILHGARQRQHVPAGFGADRCRAPRRGRLHRRPPDGHRRAAAGAGPLHRRAGARCGRAICRAAGTGGAPARRTPATCPPRPAASPRR